MKADSAIRLECYLYSCICSVSLALVAVSMFSEKMVPASGELICAPVLPSMIHTNEHLWNFVHCVVESISDEHLVHL